MTLTMARTDSASGEARSVGVAEKNIIKVVARRRPGQWVAALLVLVLVGLFVYSAATDKAYDWATYRRHIFDREFGRAAIVTLELTGIASAIGVVLAVLLSAMRMAHNVVLRSIAWGYLWLFRATPVYLQLVFWGLLASLYGHIGIGVPFGSRVASIDTTTVLTAFVVACVGLGLNAAAYLGELFRSSCAGVGARQRDAAVALGMSPWVVRRRVVWPQASRRIVPGVVAQIATTVKVTALVIAVPLTTDLYGRSIKTAAIAHRQVPVLLDAVTWYLVIVSALLIVQWLVTRAMTRSARDGQAS